MFQNFNVNFADLYLFYHVVEKGGFLKAAEALNICQAKVSRRISHLEAALETILLYRDMRSIRLTETGKIVFESAKVMLEQITCTHADVQYCHQNAAGQTTLSVTVGFAGAWLLPVLKKFLEEYPDIEMHMTDNGSGDSNVMLGNADIAIASSKPEMRESLICEVLCEYPFFLYASEDYLRKRGTPHSAQDLDRHDIILVKSPYAMPLKGLLETLLYIGRKPNNPRKPYMTMSPGHDMNLAIAVAQGYGIGFLPSFFVETFPNVRRITLSDHQEILEKRIHRKYLVYPKFLNASVRHNKLIDFIKEKAQDFYKKR